MNVPFNDLTVPTRQIEKKFLAAVRKLLGKGNFILTEEVKAFESAWAREVGVTHCVGTSSGADALYLALRSLDIGHGDEVITQGNAYNATVTAILRTGADVRFADINENDLCMNPANI